MSSHILLSNKKLRMLSASVLHGALKFNFCRPQIMADSVEDIAADGPGLSDQKTTDVTEQEHVKTLSKSQLKKMRRKEKWEKVKAEKR